MKASQNQWPRIPKTPGAVLCDAPSSALSPRQKQPTGLLEQPCGGGWMPAVTPVPPAEHTEAALSDCLLKFRRLMSAFTCSLFPRWTRGHWVLGTAPHWRQDVHSEEAFARPARAVRSILMTSPPWFMSFMPSSSSFCFCSWRNIWWEHLSNRLLVVILA